jgi:hypothetical protein
MRESFSGSLHFNNDSLFWKTSLFTRISPGVTYNLVVTMTTLKLSKTQAVFVGGYMLALILRECCREVMPLPVTEI